MRGSREERDLAARLLKAYFGATGTRGVEWDWRDDRYDTWLVVAREALRYTGETKND